MPDLPLNSRYLKTPAIKHKGVETLGVWAGKSWLTSPVGRVIVAASPQAGRADLIAAEYLGSTDLWWVILYYNNQTNINWPRAGDEVLIPRRDEVLGT